MEKNLISALIGLGGVLIGLFASPFLKHLFDKYSRRMRIRAELVKFTYQFYALQKQYLRPRNLHTFYTHFYNQIIVHNAKDVYNFELIQKLIDQHENSCNELFTKLTVTESELLQLIYEARDVFSFEYFKLIKSLLMREIQYYDNAKNILIENFEELQIDRFLEYERTQLFKKLTSLQKQTEAKMYETVDEIYGTLKTKFL
jgi:hypothetical protein